MSKCSRAALAIVCTAFLFAACAGDSVANSSVLPEANSPADRAETTPAQAELAATSTRDSAPGLIYLTTIDGDVQVLDPSSGETDLIWDTSDGTSDLAFEVAPLPDGDGVQLLLAGREILLDTSLHELKNGQISNAANAASFDGTICLDPHAMGAFTVGHQIVPGFDNTQGTEFDQVAAGSGSESLADLTRNSTFCPRYNSTRDTVATSGLRTAGDPATETLFVDTPDGSHQVAVSGCGLTQRAFSPDDTWLLVSVVCYQDRWADSGLYALAMNDLFGVSDLTDMVRLGTGIFGRTTWHAEGLWLAATAVEAQPGQTVDLDISDLRSDIVVVSTDGQSFRHRPLGSATTPHSLVWASQDVHTPA